MAASLTDKPAAHPTASGRNSHIPYGLYVCSDGTQVLHCRNYTPMWIRSGDGEVAQRVPLLPDGKSRWVNYESTGYFFIKGSHPIGRNPRRRSVKAAVVNGERILENFIAGRPIWQYVARGGDIPTGINAWAC